MRSATTSPKKRELTLNGLKVLDLTWVMAGPLTTAYLGMHGAIVIKIESEKRLDHARCNPPWLNGIAGRERASMFNALNCDKLSLQLNLSTDGGKQVLKRLVAWADVILESFTPGVLARLGLSYEELKKIKPDIIMVSMSIQGQNGPESMSKGFGSEIQALAGFTSFIGYPDGPPLMTGLAYTDFIVPWYTLIGILAALEHREHNGEGQYIDVSHLETGVTFLAVEAIEYLAGAKLKPRIGNRSPWAAPHGAYQLRGEDRWCVLAVLNDMQWHSLKTIMGDPDWARQAKFHSLLDRKMNEEELDKLIGQWTCTQDEGVIFRLQAAGVPASIVSTGQDLSACPQLKERGHFLKVVRSDVGPVYCEMPSYRCVPPLFELPKPPPSFGEHTEYVCKNILCMSDEEFLKMYDKGVFY